MIIYAGNLKERYELYVEFMKSMGAQYILTFDEWLNI